MIKYLVLTTSLLVLTACDGSPGTASSQQSIASSQNSIASSLASSSVLTASSSSVKASSSSVKASSSAVMSSSSVASATVLVLEENTTGFCHVNGVVEAEHLGYSGAGYANAANSVGSKIVWNVVADKAMTVELRIRYANGSVSARPATININGEMVAAVSFDSTVAWDAWQDAVISVQLKAGDNIIDVKSAVAEGLANIDNLTVIGNGIRKGDCANANVGGLLNPPEKSAGCGKALSLQDGRRTISSGGRDRVYHIRLPRNYDANKPYRLFYVSHGLGGLGDDIYGFLDWFGLKPEADKRGVQAIWIAPSVINRGDGWGQIDHPLFENITNFAKNNLCVDTTRVFATGMSFGGMMSYALSTQYQSIIRAGFGMSPVNYNVWLPNPKRTEPIAWMQTTGMSDGITPWVQNANGKTGAKFIALEKARDNGCNVPNDIATWNGSRPTKHMCVDMEGCDEGYPVKVCTFDGGHIHDPREPGAGGSWVPAEAMDFFMQF